MRHFLSAGHGSVYAACRVAGMALAVSFPMSHPMSGDLKSMNEVFYLLNGEQSPARTRW